MTTPIVQRDERVLIVWADELDRIVPLCAEFEEKIMKLVWRSRPPAPSVVTSTTNSVTPSATASNVNLNEKGPIRPIAVTDTAVAVALAGKQISGAAEESPAKNRRWSWRLSKKKPSTVISDDLEKASAGRKARPIRLFAPVYGGLGLGLAGYFMASGVATTLVEWRLDHDYKRFALFATIPFLFCVSLVSFISVSPSADPKDPFSVLCSSNRVDLDFCVRNFTLTTCVPSCPSR